MLFYNVCCVCFASLWERKLEEGFYGNIMHMLCMCMSEWVYVFIFVVGYHDKYATNILYKQNIYSSLIFIKNSLIYCLKNAEKCG